MNRIRFFTNNFWNKFWPFITIFVLLSVHLLLIFHFKFEPKCTNKTFALITQLIGVIVVGCSIYSTINTIKNESKSFFSMLIDSFKSPISTTSGEFTFGLPQINGSLEPLELPSPYLQCNEENINHLKSQIDQLKHDVALKLNELEEKIAARSKEIETKLQETNLVLQNHKSAVEKIFAEGVNVQIFGILLILYGAVSGYLA